MTIDLNFDDVDETVTRSDQIGYFHPREIVADGSLSVSRRRALLAYWMSDANAIVGARWTRHSGYFATNLADLREALQELDEVEAMFGAMSGQGSHHSAA
jgi:hypothetical protein